MPTQTEPMTYREMNRRVFAGEPIPHVFFQPRMEPWFHWHKIVHQMPPRYQGMNVTQFYDDIDCSMRYLHYYTDMPDPVVRVFDDQVRVTDERDAEGGHLFAQPYRWLLSHTVALPEGSAL